MFIIKPRPKRGGTQASRRVRLSVEQLESRLTPYSASSNAWPNPALITIGFVPDGTIVGANAQGPIASNLQSALTAKFGSAATWQNQILRAAQSWAQQTNINFTVVADNGADIGSGLFQQGDPTQADIRIGGYNFNSTILAQAYMPPPINNFSIAGDIQFNSGANWNINGTYDLYTVAMHELGHALGMYHSAVVSAAMYPSYQGVRPGLSTDDINGIRSIYSAGAPRSPDAFDAAGSNSSFATATDLSGLVTPITNTLLVQGLDVSGTSDVDYYKLVLPLFSSGSYTLQVQSTGLSLLAPKVTVYAADQTTVLGSVGAASFTGNTISVTLDNMVGGQPYYLKVQGFDTSAFGTGAYAISGGGGGLLGLQLPAIVAPVTQVLNGLIPSAGGGQAIRLNPQFQANTNTADIQQTTPSAHSTAMDANGNFAVVWESNLQDGSGYGIYGQRFNLDGSPNGGEFRVNTTTAGDQRYASMAMDPTGRFVVTWSSAGQDGSGWGVYAQRYNADGTPNGTEFQVNTYTTNDQMDSQVAMDGNGNFVIAWQSTGQDGNSGGIYAQRYNANGSRNGGEFRVNTTTQNGQTQPTLAMDPAGDFVIAWCSNGQDGSNGGIFAQRYNASGVAQGGEFQVNTYTPGWQQYPTAAMDAAGDFVVTWSSNLQDGSGYAIEAQRYNAAGVAQGGEFQVNTYTTYSQIYSAVAMDGPGNFLISWTSSGGQDGAGSGVYAQQYDATGQALGSEFRVNTVTSGNQGDSAIAMNAAGQAVIVWNGNGTGDTAGVFGQTFAVGGGSGMAPMESSDTYDPNEGVGSASAPSQGESGVPSATVAGVALAGAIPTLRHDLTVQALPGGERVEQEAEPAQAFSRLPLFGQRGMASRTGSLWSEAQEVEDHLPSDEGLSEDTLDACFAGGDCLDFAGPSS